MVIEAAVLVTAAAVALVAMIDENEVRREEKGDVARTNKSFGCGLRRGDDDLLGALFLLPGWSERKDWIRR